jgi:spoIIIJ-associated protein
MPWITKEGRTVEEARVAAIAAAGRAESDLDIEVVSEGAKGLFGLGGEPAIVRVRPRDEATDVRHAFRDDITPGDDASLRTRPRPAPSEDDETEDDETEDDERDEASEDEPGPSQEVSDEEKLTLTEQQEEASRVGAEMVNGILERMGLQGDVNTRVAGGTVYIEVFGEEMGILIGRGGATLEALQEVVRAGVQRKLRTRQAVVVDVEAYWERRRGRGGRDHGNRRQGGERRSGDERRGGRNQRNGNR